MDFSLQREEDATECLQQLFDYSGDKNLTNVQIHKGFSEASSRQTLQTQSYKILQLFDILKTTQKLKKQNPRVLSALSPNMTFSCSERAELQTLLLFVLSDDVGRARAFWKQKYGGKQQLVKQFKKIISKRPRMLPQQLTNCVRLPDPCSINERVNDVSQWPDVRV